MDTLTLTKMTNATYTHREWMKKQPYQRQISEEILPTTNQFQDKNLMDRTTSFTHNIFSLNKELFLPNQMIQQAAIQNISSFFLPKSWHNFPHKDINDTRW